jgi:hypothetical protein
MLAEWLTKPTGRRHGRARRAATESNQAAVAASSARGRRRGRTIFIAGIAATTIVGAGVVNWAQDELNIQFHGFQDTRDATILSPTVDLTKDFTDRTSLRVKFGVDAISASSDSCVRCHRPGATDKRIVGSASLTRKLNDDTKLTVGAEVSHENFYQATTILTSISRNLNKGNTTVAGGYSFSLNRPVLHPSQQTETQYANDAFVSVTQTLTKSTVAQLGYEIAQINGYQNSPFLRVLVNDQLTLGNSPNSRTRQTLSARLRQALPLATYLETDYRHYLDNWSVHSNALSVGLSHYVTREILANVTYRFYQQTGAFFYAPQYFGSPAYLTSDFRLEAFDSGLYGGRLIITPRGGIWRLPDGSALTVEYQRYKSNIGFEAAIFTAGVHIPLNGR